MPNTKSAERRMRNSARKRIQNTSAKSRLHTLEKNFATLATAGKKAEASTALKQDRKSTRLNSSHTVNSYAVFCLKKKNTLRCAGAVCNPRISAFDLDAPVSVRMPQKLEWFGTLRGRPRGTATPDSLFSATGGLTA